MGTLFSDDADLNDAQDKMYDDDADKDFVISASLSMTFDFWKQNYHFLSLLKGLKMPFEVSVVANEHMLNEFLKAKAV